MEKLTLLFKALSDRNRLRVVGALLRYDELCACQLLELLAVTGATASRHMGVLIASGLVESRKEGRWVYYRICRERAGFEGLIGWVEAQLEGDLEAGLDVKALEKITACEPEDLCRRQRGEACCPSREQEPS
jgi:ArsR family transcriptional regulator, arsenate/arsenite/antimonite-responsive transcriptional repressor